MKIRGGEKERQGGKEGKVEEEREKGKGMRKDQK